MIQLTPIAPSHAPVISALLRLSFPDGWSEDAVSSLLELFTTQGWLALDGEEPVGVILLQLAAGQAEVLTLAVRPERRKLGVAKALLEQALAHVLQSGAAEIILDVAVDNAAALALYQSFGFVEVARRKGYYGSGESRTDAVVMKLSL